MRALVAASFALMGATGLIWAQAYAAPNAPNAPPTTSNASTSVGNAVRGASVYANRCGGCHSVEVNRVGPAHRGVVGRRAGTAPGFVYSPALKNATLTFNEATLDRWLTNPQATVPGTRMFFRLGAAQERADVIAYLKTQSVAR
jgi:cytochrome c